VSLAMSSPGLTCAVINDGSLMCWGTTYNPYAQTSTTPMGPLPTAVAGIGNVTALSLGFYHACALKTDATVQCWGTYGLPIYSTTAAQMAPVAILDPTNAPLNSVQALGSGENHTCATKFDGSMHCWGSDFFGQLGDGNNNDHMDAQPVVMMAMVNQTNPLSGVAISTGYLHSCVLRASGDVACWGLGTYGNLGNGSNTDSVVPVSVSIPGGVTAISAGGLHTCALKTNGDVTCWGANQSGQLGDGSLITSNVPVSVNIPGGAVAISSGGNHTCAIKTNGDIACWGLNNAGQLGDGSFTSSNFPTSVSIPGGVTAISAGDNHTCAIKTNGDLVCWGNNASGQLGDGSTTSSSTPVTTSVTGGFSKISAGYMFTCAVQTNGLAICWGYGSQGQLGNGVSASSAVAVPISLSSAVISISAGVGYACVVLPNGDASCWGTPFTTGPLGLGSITSTNTPVTISAMTGFSSISSGYIQTCALKTTGDVACWGSNILGQDKNGFIIGSPYAPSLVNGITALALQPIVFWI
jgi:alpha-tubulin suppressor-like RCC1 family protein